jgi:hypothetical protein
MSNKTRKYIEQVSSNCLNFRNNDKSHGKMKRFFNFAAVADRLRFSHHQDFGFQRKLRRSQRGIAPPMAGYLL